MALTSREAASSRVLPRGKLSTHRKDLIVIVVREERHYRSRPSRRELCRPSYQSHRRATRIDKAQFVQESKSPSLSLPMPADGSVAPGNSSRDTRGVRTQQSGNRRHNRPLLKPMHSARRAAFMLRFDSAKSALAAVENRRTSSLQAQHPPLPLPNHGRSLMSMKDS